jgi:hypothetical protein
LKNSSSFLFAVLLGSHVFIAGCNGGNEQQNTVVGKDSSKRQVKGPSKDTILHITKTDSFLLHPFDLYKFKKKKGSAQGGGHQGESYLYKPSFKGFYWGYMMFPPVFQGYIGKNTKDTVYKENSFEMVTYRPEGNPNDRFNWDVTGEILIEVDAGYNDFDLPELAFVELDTTEISKRLGNKYFVKDSCMVYSKNNALLILKVNGRKVERLKYLLLNQIPAKDNIPKGVLSFDD